MITLIGKDLAKEGQEFVFLGPADVKNADSNHPVLEIWSKTESMLSPALRTMNKNARFMQKK